MNVKRMSDTALAREYRDMRAQARPVFNELKKRGYNITEHHGHGNVLVTSFENIIISKPTVVKL